MFKRKQNKAKKSKTEISDKEKQKAIKKLVKSLKDSC